MGSIFSKNVRLKPYNTFRVGGNADSLAIVSHIQELCEALDESGGNALILGRGSNVLVSDKGYAGFVIINRADNVLIDNGEALVYSGKTLSGLSTLYAQNSCSGLEWACGIPGSVGGAVIMNAGAYGQSMSDIILEVLTLYNGRKQWLSCDMCGFGYRTSKIRGVVLAVKLKCVVGKTLEINKIMQEFTLKRKASQPSGASAGSVFKASDKPAGWYIEQCGLKGFRVGGACVSSKHANFIINESECLAADIFQIINTIKSVVYNKFQIKLFEEIRYIGEF